jgi:hypothetical protein
MHNEMRNDTRDPTENTCAAYYGNLPREASIVTVTNQTTIDQHAGKWPVSGRYHKLFFEFSTEQFAVNSL